MQGRKVDYTVNISGCSITRCAHCRKKFRLSLTDHVYKRTGLGSRKNFCSYGCMMKWDKKQQEKDRKKERSARNPTTNQYEKKTLEEWAEDMGVDYAKLWKLNILNKTPLAEAINILQIESWDERMRGILAGRNT